MEQITYYKSSVIEGAIMPFPASDGFTASAVASNASVAICGMAMRLPGGIKTSEQLWKFLIDKKDARDSIGIDRYSATGFSRRNVRGDDEQNSAQVGGSSVDDNPRETGMTHGYMLRGVDLSRFDASFFSLTRKELEMLDPQQRILLELTRLVVYILTSNNLD